jgi:acetyltransferase-like isoleucine patch superfamily enzyme
MHEIIIAGVGRLELGRECSIGINVKITFIRPAIVNICDYVTIGDDVKMVVDGGDVYIGDWTTLHAETLVLSKVGVKIAAHCWFGQNTILDGTGGLTIENGVRVGMYSQLWSHVAAGEQIEGCTLFGQSPIHIGSNVWLVGSCMVAPGVRIGDRTIALAGCNVTKSCGDSVVLAGSPAKQKEGLSFYRSIDLDEKFEMLYAWLLELMSISKSDVTELNRDDATIRIGWSNAEEVKFFKFATDYSLSVANRPDKSTYCCVESKIYIKAFTSAEKKTLKFLAGNKARFYIE